MSRLIWIYAVCKSLLLLPFAVKELIIYDYIYIYIYINLECYEPSLYHKYPLAWMAQLDASLTGYREVAGSRPALSAAYFRGD